MKNSLFVIVACAIGVLAANNVEKTDAEIEFITVKNLTEYLHTAKLNLNILPMKRDSSNLVQIRYTLGNRISGKRINKINFDNFKTKKEHSHELNLFKVIAF